MCQKYTFVWVSLIELKLSRSTMQGSDVTRVSERGFSENFECLRISEKVWSPHAPNWVAGNEKMILNYSPMNAQYKEVLHVQRIHFCDEHLPANISRSFSFISFSIVGGICSISNRNLVYFNWKSAIMLFTVLLVNPIEKGTKFDEYGRSVFPQLTKWVKSL